MGAEPPAYTAAGHAGHLFVVYNSTDSVSCRVASYYRRQRSIPPRNALGVEVDSREEISLREYRSRIEEPVRQALRARGLADSVDYLVLAKGVPLRIKDGGWSVDGFLGAMDLGIAPLGRRDTNLFGRMANPYFQRREHFQHLKFGIYLVTRLDGYTEADAMALVDRARESRRLTGPFLLDVDPRRDGAGYGFINDAMRRAAALLAARGLEAILDTTRDFVHPARELAGYYSWGSNDGSFDPEEYRALRFLPGAIAETAVSTSARTFARTSGGQSLIADLIAGGVTGVKGYVSEPLAIALCRADILFDRYTAGYNLAESFYMATPFIQWKDVVVGDPLVAPFAPARP